MLTRFSAEESKLVKITLMASANKSAAKMQRVEDLHNNRPSKALNYH
jgi:hypothetical protein